MRLCQNLVGEDSTTALCQNPIGRVSAVRLCQNLDRQVSAIGLCQNSVGEVSAAALCQNLRHFLMPKYGFYHSLREGFSSLHRTKPTVEHDRTGFVIAFAICHKFWLLAFWHLHCQNLYVNCKVES